MASAAAAMPPTPPKEGPAGEAEGGADAEYNFRRRFQSVVRTIVLTMMYGFVLMLGLFAVFLLGAILG